jgi:hypothetical protein
MESTLMFSLFELYDRKVATRRKISEINSPAPLPSNLTAQIA